MCGLVDLYENLLMDLRASVAELATRATDLSAVREGLDVLLRREIGYDLAAISTVDPATMLWTSCYVSGVAPGGARDRERVIFDLEFRGVDVNAYSTIAAQAVPAASLHEATGGDVTKAARWEPLLKELGVVDEARVVLTTGQQAWGTLTLYRTGHAQPFSPKEIGALGAASSVMAATFRLALLRTALAAPGVEHPPGTLTVTADGEIQNVSSSAQTWLDALDDRGRIPSAVASVAAAARAGDGLASAALPSRSGGFVVLHGSPVAGSKHVAVIIEAARPAVVSDIIVQAHGLTPRERDICGLAAQGRSTRQMARDLGISPFTVADHLKSVFSKIGVTSRSELVAALYHQHYEPRSDVGAIPSPYGWYLDDNVDPLTRKG